MDSGVIILQSYAYKLFLSAAFEGKDWSIPGSRIFNFSTFNQLSTMADEPIVINIIDDSVVNRSISLICNLQTGVVDRVQTENPKQVTISIEDDEGIILCCSFLAPCIVSQ